MNSHDELDLLSPYLDGELDASDRARLDVHMASCAECRATLLGLQATLADLRTLPEPIPTPQDSWALRAAIRRARSPMRKWQRVSWAAGAVAAAAIVFAAVTLPGSNPARDLTAGALQGESASNVPIYQSGQNLSAIDAQGRLLELVGITGRSAGTPAAAAAPLGAGGGSTENQVTSDTARVVTPGVTAFSLYAAPADDRAAIDRCVSVVRGSTQEFLEPIRYEIATFESKPSYLLFFRSSARYELWVVARGDCTVLYFGQA
ncbi:MAG: zf-HC2 domain-containing protein [Actinomycetota bacterium]